MSEGGGESVQVSVQDASPEVDQQAQPVQSQSVPHPLQLKPSLHPNTEKMFGSEVVLEAQKKYDDPELQRRQDARAFSKSTQEGRDVRAQAANEAASLRDMGKLQRAREILQRFYSNQSSRIQEIKQRDELEHYLDEEGGVEDLAQLGQYVVHAIKPGLAKWISPHLSDDWRDKLASFVDLQPTISASSIHAGKRANLWYPFGVVLRSGRIEDVSVVDAGSISHGLKERFAPAPQATSIRNYEQKIRKYNESNYNEIILGGDPAGAGLFISLDDPKSLMAGSDEYVSIEEAQRRATGLYAGGSEVLRFTDIFSEARRYGMKVFVFKNGVAYESTLDEGGRLILGQEIPPQEMMKQTYEIPEENKAGIHEQAVKSIPPELLKAA